EHLVRLVDPGVRALQARDAGRVVIAAPEDEGLAVVQAGAEVAAEGLAATEMDHRRWASIAGKVLGGDVLAEGAAVVGMQAAHEPAVLLGGPEGAAGQALPVGADLGNGEQAGAGVVEDDGGDVVIEQDPL